MTTAEDDRLPSPAVGADRWYLVALEECGMELQAPHLLTTRKRRIETGDVDAGSLPRDSLRFIGWDPDALRAVFPGLDPAASYMLEAVFLCERDVRRVQRITAAGRELPPAIELAPGTVTEVRVAVPADAIRDRTLEVRVERVEGPDAILSELRLLSTVPVAPTITVVGESRGGLIGTVATPDGRGVADAVVRVTGDAGALDVRTDAAGAFRVTAADALPLGRHGAMTLATDDGAVATAVTVDTRHLARGLRELPPGEDRVDLAGTWGYHGGSCSPGEGAVGELRTTRVPGHVIFDALVPDDGAGTFHRSFELPEHWAGRSVFLRCDGAYGRAEVVVNGELAAVHSSGATSFDADLGPFLRPGANDLAITLTEYTPHAVLDDMSWYAHMSLLGIWRDIGLFSVPAVHLGQLAIEADWDAARTSGTLGLGVDVVNASPHDRGFQLDVQVRDRGGEVVWRTSRAGSVEANGGRRVAIETGALAVEPWSAETPRLYDLEITIAAAADRPQAYRRRVGFRRVETRGNQLVVNGAPIRIRGVNRHDSRILKGRALSHEEMRDDIVNLRETNVNVIRTSHYPPSPYLLDVCDEVGMFVFEQPPICFSGGFDDHHWTRTNESALLAPFLLEVTAETVARDAGHASVIVWDLGNESRWGPAFDLQLALVREMDPTRPTTFSFDLNELGPENALVRKPATERPALRSYHYPGWDRTWQEDLDWLGAFDEPTVLDEYAPVFAPCLRGPGEGYGLAIDPGIRDYWGAGYQPFMRAALGERGVIGGLIWGGFGEVFAIPLDLTVGEGPWAHLPAMDYVRTNDHYPSEPGVFRRGDGDWGIFDAWNRPRPERWHVHQMYSPIEWGAATFAASGERVELLVTNRFSHRSLAGLDADVSGGRLEAPAALSAEPGRAEQIVIVRDPGSETVRVELRHEEGWLVDGWEAAWPGAARPLAESLLEAAVDIQLDLATPGRLALRGGGRDWLRRWPEIHVVDVDQPHIPVPSPATDGRRVTVGADGSARAPLASRDWEGGVTARIDGRSLVIEYDATYRGPVAFNAKEVGLTIHPAPDLADLWWRRVAEWSIYPDGHVGRPAGVARADPGSNGALQPATRWEADATAAGSNDYRSAKRSILAAGSTDGVRSITVVSDGTQHIRAELVDGLPVLHILDWYGGVRTVEGNHPIWSAYFGAGRRIETGTRIEGRIVLVAGRRP